MMLGPLDFKTFCTRLKILAGPFIFERSLKVDPQDLNTDRCLMTWPRESLGAGASAKYLRLLEDMGFADAAVTRLDERQRQARFIHFGFEGSATAPVMKAYLEFEPDPAPGSLRYLAVKSAANPAANAYVFSEYRQHAYQTRDQRRLDALSGPVPPSMHALEAKLVEIFWADPALCDVLQVRDLGTSRVSFDWNTARAAVSPSTQAALLDAARAFFEQHQSPQASATALAGVGVLNHIALGLSRTEQPFLTLYHDAEEWGDIHEFTDHRFGRAGLAE